MIAVVCVVGDSRAAITQAPANTSPPTIAGTAQQGSTLTLTEGQWSGATAPLTHQWQRCDSAGANCQNIPDETGTTYLLVADDVGHTIRVLETATNGTESAVAESAPSEVVLAAAVAPAISTPPIVSGDAQQGKTLAVAPGQWTG